MRKVIPFHTTEKRRLRKLHTAKEQTPPSLQAEEEGMVAIQLKDGTWKTITGSDLELDVEYQDGVPYLVVRASR